MTISFARHQFPPAIIRRAVWLYLRFTLSYRDVEDLLAERRPGYLLRNGAAMGIEVRAVVRRRTSASTPAANSRWHLDEMAVTIAGPRFWLLARG
jgi:putative transposase